MANNHSQYVKPSAKHLNIDPLTNLKFTYFAANLACAFDTIFKILAFISIVSATGVAFIIAIIPDIIKDGIQHHIFSATVSTSLTMYTTVHLFLASLCMIYSLRIVYQFLKLAFAHGDEWIQNSILMVGNLIAIYFMIMIATRISKSDFELNSLFINQTLYTFIAFACLFLAARIIMQLVAKMAQTRFNELFYTKEFLDNKDDVKLSLFATDRQKQLERLVQPQWHDRTHIHELTFTQLPLSEHLTTVFQVDLNKQSYNNVFDFKISPVISEFEIVSSRSARQIVTNPEKES